MGDKMKKFYCFKQGQKVPRWLMDFVSKNRQAEIKNKKGKIVFAKSCLSIRQTGTQTVCLLLKSKIHTDDIYFTIKQMHDADIGGVGIGSGFAIASKEKQTFFGENKHYQFNIINGKEVLTEIK